MGNYWEKRKVLVTGAGGFIGSHLVEKLVELKAEVKAFIRYNSRGDRGALELLSPILQEKIQFFFGDLRDRTSVELAMENVDTVFHLGSLIAIPYSYLHPDEVIETNVLGTLNVMYAAKIKKVSQIIHTSTSEVYGSAQYLPIDEKHPLIAQSPYAASKIAADKIAESFYRSYELPVTIFRPFNAYGPRQSARAVIPTIISQALISDTVYLGAMHPVRDFTYVSDLISAFLKIAELEPEKSVGEVFNCGTGVGLKISDLADKIITLIGRNNIKIVFDAARIRPAKSEVECLIADNTKLRTFTNWEPEVSLEKGLKATIDWISTHINLYRPHIYTI